MKKNVLYLFAALAFGLTQSCSDDNEKKCAAPPTVSAGDDQVVVGTSVTLTGTSSEDHGTWTIISGQGGKIETGATVTFTGVLKTTYKLKWESEK